MSLFLSCTRTEVLVANLFDINLVHLESYVMTGISKSVFIKYDTRSLFLFPK